MSIGEIQRAWQFVIGIFETALNISIAVLSHCTLRCQMTFDSWVKGKRQAPPPDPCKYSIPSTIGSGPKYSLHFRHKVYDADTNPDYNLLPATLDHHAATIGPQFPPTPPPTVNPSPDFNTSSLGEGPKAAMHIRHKYPMSTTPGPGSYVIPDSFDGPVFTVGVGGRNSFIIDNNIVPPGSYELPCPMHERHPIAIHNRNREPFRRRGHPGPCYDVALPIGQGAPSVGFSKAERFPPIPQTPGPGDYDHYAPFGKRSQILPRLRSRIPLKDPDRNQMPYYHLGTTINPEKKSLLKRPDTSYDTMSPGPAYDVRSALAQKPKTIGVRHLHKDPRADNPSPDSYWMAQIPPKAPPIVGFTGPADRCPVNLAKEAKKPGPGYYESRTLYTPGKPGFKFTTKPNNDVRPDTAAPYHGSKSTLGGPLYTIGLKDA
jgi:hypothetical protein